MNKIFSVIGLFVGSLALGLQGALAAEGAAASSGDHSLIAIGAGLAVGLAALGGGFGQGRVAGSALESIGRNPSAAGKLNTPMILGLVFVETLVILSFVVAFLLQNKI
jgi:F-type H+-transporting ATPase subunit c